MQTVGIVAAFTQRLPLVRAYALLSIVTTILVLAVGLVRVIVHFVFKVRFYHTSFRRLLTLTIRTM